MNLYNKNTLIYKYKNIFIINKIVRNFIDGKGYKIINNKSSRKWYLTKKELGIYNIEKEIGQFNSEIELLNYYLINYMPCHILDGE